MKRTVREGTQRRTARGIGAVLLTLLVLSAPLFAKPLDEAAVRGAAERCVRSALAGLGDVEIEWTSSFRLEELEGEDLDVRAELNRRIDSYGPVVVSLQFMDGDEVTDRRVVSARVRLFRDVLVADRALGRHEALGAGDVRRERREVRTMADRVLGDPAALAGMRARRMVGEGDVITTDDVELIPLVRRGERVLVTVSYGGITVTATAKALDDGVRGDVISVKNERSGRRLQGIVVAEGVVRVDDARSGGNGS